MPPIELWLGSAPRRLFLLPSTTNAANRGRTDRLALRLDRSDSTSNSYSAPPECRASCVPAHAIDLSELNRHPHQRSVFHGCLGLIEIANDIFVGLIQEVEKVGEIEGHSIFRILKVVFYSLLSDKYDNLDANVADNSASSFSVGAFIDDASQANTVLIHPCAAISKLLSAGSFYFCHSLDLTRSLKQRINSSKDKVSVLDSSDTDFFWNFNMLRPLLLVREHDIPYLYGHEKKSEFDKDGMLVMAIQGFVGMADVRFGKMAIISRLSCARAGTRFNARGIDDDGNVSNFVETEFLLYHCDKITFSFIQIRGSVPVFWEQSGFQVTHKVDISRGPELTAPASKKHFQYLKDRYGKFHIVNLLSQKEGSAENLLSESFKNQLRRFQESHGGSIPYTGFDFHAAVTGNNYEKAALVLDHIRYSLDDWGFFITRSDEGQIVMEQEGVMRINCLDCLDRTNHIQCIVCKFVLERCISAFGKRGELDEFATDSFNGLWADNGDWLSRIYAGTGAIKSSMTRKGKQTMLGILNDAAKSVNRFYINNFQDKSRQDAIDSILGRNMPTNSILKPSLTYEGTLQNATTRSLNNSSVENIDVLIATWNVNGKLPYGEPLDEWLCCFQSQSPELVIVGIQELIELTPGQIVSADTDQLRLIWESHLLATTNQVFSGDYGLLRSLHLVALGLFVFVRSDKAENIRKVEVSIVRTGLGGMAGNKGGIGLRLLYNDTPMIFITAHLAAGQSAVEERNRDYWTITNGLAFKGGRVEDHDKVFWLGDFNYRINLPTDEARKLVRNNALDSLLEFDQLNIQRRIGETFPDFLEGPLTFHPTYKYDNGSNIYDTGEKARVPSWTDRILYKGVDVQLIQYARAELLISDHRPVRGLFRIEVSKINGGNGTGRSTLNRVSERVEPVKFRQGVDLAKVVRPPSDGTILIKLVDEMSKSDPFNELNSISAKLPPPSSKLQQWWNTPVDEAWIPKQGNDENPFYSFE